MSDDQKVIQAISHIVGDDFCVELDMESAFRPELLTEREKECQAKLSAIYRLAHSHDQSTSCYSVHEDWRAELANFEGTA